MFSLHELIKKCQTNAKVQYLPFQPTKLANAIVQNESKSFTVKKLKKANKVTSLKKCFVVHGIQSKRFCVFYEYEVERTALFLKKFKSAWFEIQNTEIFRFFSLSTVRFVGDTSAALSAQFRQHTRKKTVGKFPHLLGNMKEIRC